MKISTLPQAVYRRPLPQARPVESSHSGDTFTPSKGLTSSSTTARTFLGIGIGVGVSTLACLALTATINPVGAAVILSSGFIGGIVGSGREVQPPDDFIDPSKPFQHDGYLHV